MNAYATITDMPGEKTEKQYDTTRRRGRPPKLAAKPLTDAGMEKPTQLKIGSAYDTHILTHPRLKLPNTVPATAAKPGISITLQVPSLRRPKPQSPADVLLPVKASQRRRWLQPVIIIPIALVIVAGVGFGYRNMVHSSSAVPAAVNTGSKRTAPDYKPLVPSDAPTAATDYNGDKDLVSYNTNFSEARVTVSEQHLPVNFATDPNALLRAADSIDAKHKIDTGNGPVYVANSTTDDSQLGIYAGKNVLVFIHTDRKLDDVSWKNFVELMQEKSWQDIK